MRPIEQEQNIEVVKQYAILLENELKRVLKKQELLNEDQQWLSSLEDQLKRVRNRFLVKGRETLDKDGRPVGHHQEDLKLHSEYPQAKFDESAPDDFQDRADIVTHEFEDEVLEYEAKIRGISRGKKAWEPLPLFQESREITVVERTFKEVLHRQRKYKLKARYNKTGKEVIITAPGPIKLREKSKYSLDFAIAVARDKYEYHLPLERQRRQMEAKGLNVEVKTLYGLVEAVAEHCNKVIPQIKKEIQNDFCAVHLDESPWPIQGEESKSYMWVMSNRKGSYFQFEPSRSGKVAKEILKDYEGSVLTDGYSGYSGVKKQEKMRIGHCWAHARREFFDRIPDYPEAKEAVEKIDSLFKVESKAKSFEELRVLRKTESQVILDDFYKWMLKIRGSYLSQEGIHKAIAYCLRFWKELTLFLEDLSLPLSNNDAERALRHVVMGRKNFNGSKTINGADTAASIYTVIESCKKVGLQPSMYLKYLIGQNWNGDRAKTPLGISVELFGKNEKVLFPQKKDWKIH